MKCEEGALKYKACELSNNLHSGSALAWLDSGSAVTSTNHAQSQISLRRLVDDFTHPPGTMDPSLHHLTNVKIINGESGSFQQRVVSTNRTEVAKILQVDAVECQVHVVETALWVIPRVHVRSVHDDRDCVRERSLVDTDMTAIDSVENTISDAKAR